MAKWLLPISMTFLLLAGCQQGPPAAEEPVWGKQPCGHCAMLLSERLHGAQALTASGDRVFFDDTGCLIAWEGEHPGQTSHRWVRQFDQDPHGTGWLPAEPAAFYRVKHTPMGFGYAAVAHPRAAPSGQAAVPWAEVVAKVRTKLRGMQGP